MRVMPPKLSAGGVIQPSCMAMSADRSPVIRPSCQVMPTPITVAPGRSMPGVSMPGTPAAAMTMSACRVLSAILRDRLCTTVTSALPCTLLPPTGEPQAADKFPAPDDRDLQARKVRVDPGQNVGDPAHGACNDAGRCIMQRHDIMRMQSIHVLVDCNGAAYGARIQVGRQRQLDHDAVIQRVGIQPGDMLQ